MPVTIDSNPDRITETIDAARILTPAVNDLPVTTEFKHPVIRRISNEHISGIVQCQERLIFGGLVSPGIDTPNSRESEVLTRGIWSKYLNSLIPGIRHINLTIFCHSDTYRFVELPRVHAIRPKF